jgi:hypothetical protein
MVIGFVPLSWSMNTMYTHKITMQHKKSIARIFFARMISCMDYEAITRHTIDAITVDRVCALNNVKRRTVTTARKQGVMPAAWAINIRAAAAELSPPLLVPDQCFSFRGVGQ